MMMTSCFILAALANCYSFAMQAPNRMRFRNPGFLGTHKLLKRPFTDKELLRAVLSDYPKYHLTSQSTDGVVCGLRKVDGTNFHFARRSQHKWVYAQGGQVYTTLSFQSILESYPRYRQSFCISLQLMN